MSYRSREIPAESSHELSAALSRIAKLEDELNDRDRQLEALITDHDKDIVDLRKSFEIDGFKRPPLHPNTASSVGGPSESHNARWSMESVRLSGDDTGCQECARMRKQLRTYEKQWKEMSKHFKQVPALLEGMIRRTDTLVSNVTKLSN